LIECEPAAGFLIGFLMDILLLFREADSGIFQFAGG
jgi:hypothetical protein